MKRLLLLSGPIAVGKSAVAKQLVQEHKFEKMGSGQYLTALANKQGTGTSRADLQLLGDRLDEQTDYRWLVDEIAKVRIAATPEQESWLFDSVRKRKQVFNFKEIYGRLALHVHFNAPEEVLEQRYQARLANGGEYAGNTPYNVAKSHLNEIESRSLIDVADVVVDLGQKSPEKAAAEILKQWDNGGERCAR
ncbi:AAA family ATPase [Tardiphaga sp. OK245]|uniref:AAA family ATPase n=1 Tax=Tardiphaga sp. OK245 TaxID=1855306 RepID=UPI0008A7A987|nr:AAA family ATPase [Tardiphaga sp. OK245]SEH40038.1 Adenylate kinase [Tardiphaga sp. OK245]